MDPAERVALPRYLRTPKAQLFSATFGDLTLSVEASRARRYPGLQATAPDTRGLYRMAGRLLEPRGTVLDLGCGSGIGTAELLLCFDAVAALDQDDTAARFARAYLKDVDVACRDGAESAHGETRYDAVCVVDVLGHASAPLELLRAARRRLSPSGRMFVAEVRACPAQTLMPPMLRAFSPRGLESLLVRAGLDAEVWPAAGHFVACVARLAEGDEWRWLERGDHFRAAGARAEALDAYARLAQSSRSALREEALLGSAAVYRDAGDLNSACRCLLEVLAFAPGSVRSRVGLSEFSLQSGEQPQALELAVSAVEADPCDGAAVQAVARAAEGLRDVDAYATWRIANGLAPADFDTAIEVARCAAGLGDLPFAIWVLERLRDFRADLPADFHVTLSWLYLTSGRGGDARLEAELARVKDADSAAVIELCAQLSSEAGAA
jgi:SAM-dependent methyltransferase